MAAVLQRPSIKYLSPQLADQIAAGEVIERPSSVLKELIENALDAHASRIDIDLAEGGIERIRITDNGDGILSDELPLAVSRHATSKLTSIQDLLRLQTLGFRGEALASICSVSQWLLISCSDNSTTASRLSSVNPNQTLTDNHPRGTTVQIDKLFHNTPARKKFLRAERTEFRHCDDVIRRMALARFDVGFYAKHNGRQVHRLPAVKDDIGRTRRVTQLCGEQFIREALAIDFAHDGMRLWGWISAPAYSRQQTDLQYFYINGRVIRDRMLNHAIRFAYQQLLPAGRQSAYVLHLEVEPDRFDVNVHPTKQEVRFREARLVHDFISHSLRQALHTGMTEQRNLNAATQYPHNRFHYEVHDASVREPFENYHEATVATAHSELLFQRYLFVRLHGKYLLVDACRVYARWASERWYEQINSGTVKQRPLLIPLRFKLDKKESAMLENKQLIFTKLGFDLALISENEIVVRFIPALLSVYQSVQEIVTAVLLAPNCDHNHELLFNLLSVTLPDENKLDLHLIQKTIQSDPQRFRDCWHEVSEADLGGLLQK